VGVSGNMSSRKSAARIGPLLTVPVAAQLKGT
jgi:hypothetical protein